MRLIDRQDLMKLFHEYQPRLATNVSEFGKALEELPTVDAEPVRHGRWVKNFETVEGRSLRCSRCLMVFWVGHGRDGNYCPNCGAKMDGDVEYEID